MTGRFEIAKYKIQLAVLPLSVFISTKVQKFRRFIARYIDGLSLQCQKIVPGAEGATPVPGWSTKHKGTGSITQRADLTVRGTKKG